MRYNHASDTKHDPGLMQLDDASDLDAIREDAKLLVMAADK